jgi:hypothetical protein
MFALYDIHFTLLGHRDPFNANSTSIANEVGTDGHYLKNRTVLSVSTE